MNNKILEYAIKVLDLEATALQNVKRFIDQDFIDAVDKITNLASHGRVIVSGVGKTSFIAMKISATLASTGTPSFFLHPAEALHGDLGRYSPDDIAIILSHSGETDEIVKILPAIKAVGCPLISITASKQSTLGHYSNLVIQTGIIEEAGPLGLAPTTSTTVMLGIGDALAMSILNCKAFSKEQFAFYHPGGSLGRSLLTAKQIMRTGEQHCVVNQELQTREVLKLISSTKGRPGAATIVSQEGFLLGIFTDGDLRRCLESGSDFLDLPIKAVMTKNPITLRQDSLTGEILNLFTRKKLDQVIIVDQEQHALGLVDIQDLAALGLLSLEKA